VAFKQSSNSKIEDPPKYPKSERPWTVPGGGQMPPGNRPKLSFEEIATIQKWQEEGLNP